MEAIIDRSFGQLPSIRELTRCIREHRMSPVDITERLLARIDKLNPHLNAFRVICRERALSEAEAAEARLASGRDLGPLHGIPYAVKDIFDVEGLPTTAGTKLLAENVALSDAAIVDRLKRAGMILLGKTNTVQLAYGGVGINYDQGTPHNPWQRNHYVPGGSSSGSAVAVTSGMAPLAIGSDTAGSIRIPAALCGVVGLKPTVKRITQCGVYQLSWTFDSVGILARTVEDAAIWFETAKSDCLRFMTPWVEKIEELIIKLRSGIKGLRVAFGEGCFLQNVDPEIDTAFRESERVFRELGADVKWIKFAEADAAAATNVGGVIISAEAYTVNEKLLEENFDGLDAIVASRMIKGKEVSSAEYLESLRFCQHLQQMSKRSLNDIDVVIVPTTLKPAVSIVEAEADISTYSKLNASYIHNTSIGNILGLCGLSLPCGFTETGLPIGLMLYGKPFQEDVILRAGKAFEMATGLQKRVPDLCWAERGSHDS